ncbi:MAG: hypothetical protein KF900_12280 [Bacteroidetes bacterium]|nr:hypothetical protein [Bacteroidota bacterium]
MQKLFISFSLMLLFTQCRNSGNVTAELTQIAADISQSCPQMIDSETRFDGVVFKLPDTLTYNYTLVNLLAQNVDTAEFRRALFPGILSNIRVSSDMKKLRDNAIVICYAYRDKNNRPVYVFKISPNHYNKN